MRTDPETERKILELAGLSPPPAEKKPPKYRNKKVEIDGQVFDSKREANRWFELKVMEQAGAISDLKRQVNFVITVNGWAVCRYIADFTYVESGKLTVEDAKGFRTREYRLKKALMRAVHNIEIRET